MRPRSRLIGVRVEMAPTGTVGQMLRGEALDWLDVSRWVRADTGIDVLRGVGADGLTPDTGTVTFTCANDDGVWTPGVDIGGLFSAVVGADVWAADYAPGVADASTLTGVPVRILHMADPPTYGETAALHVTYEDWSVADPTYADVSTPAVLWSGVVSTVRVAWVNGMMPVARVSCADPVATVQRTPMRSLPVSMITGVGAAVWCWPLTEDGGPLSSVTSTAMPPMTKVPLAFPLEGNELEFASWPSPGSNAGGAEQSTPVWSGGGVHTGWALDTGNDPSGRLPSLSSYDTEFTLHSMIKPEGTGRVRYAVSAAGVGGSLISLGVSALDFPRLRVVTPSGIVHEVTSPTAVTPGMWHHVAVRMVGDPLTTEVELWVNGVRVHTSNENWLIYEGGSRRIVAGARITVRGELVDTWVGSVANIAAHQGPMDAFALQRIAASRTGWTGDDTCGRLNRILYALGYDRSALPEGDSTMCPQHTDGRTLADALAECAVAERAPWWVDRDGRPTMRPRSARWAAPTVATVDAYALGQGLEFGQESSARRTVVTASRPGGQSMTRRHPVADVVGEVGGPQVFMVDSDAQVESLADEMVTDRHALPRVTTESVSVDLVRSARVVDVRALLAVDVEDVIEVAGLPASAPWPSRRLLVGHVADRISADSWVRTFTVSDAPELMDVFHIGVDELDGPAVLGW